MNIYFETHDLALSTVLLSLGFKLEHLDRANPSKVRFCFRRENGLDTIIQNFWSKSLRLEPQELFANLKSLKSRLYNN